jgi:hypothetical protein
VAASVQDYLGLFRQHALPGQQGQKRQPWEQRRGGAQQLLGARQQEEQQQGGGNAAQLDAHGSFLLWSQPAVFEAELALESGEGAQGCCVGLRMLSHPSSTKRLPSRKSTLLLPLAPNPCAGAVAFRPSLAAAEAAAVSALNAAVSAVAGLPRLARGRLSGPGLGGPGAYGSGAAATQTQQHAHGGAGALIPVAAVTDPDVAAEREASGAGRAVGQAAS